MTSSAAGDGDGDTSDRAAVAETPAAAVDPAAAFHSSSWSRRTLHHKSKHQNESMHVSRRTTSNSRRQRVLCAATTDGGEAKPHNGAQALALLMDGSHWYNASLKMRVPLNQGGVRTEPTRC